ncbi:hypothetical protein E3N88_03817 [Mikania micrantha]|uniref:Uncharacterized protein n=1 Tax=Mikania micrantha TaxID=192012 RepID=A0A5N6PSL8_9ASTR|nr:hypothetical protein E3N88_03817 [Mikania micrantha]
MSKASKSKDGHFHDVHNVTPFTKGEKLVVSKASASVSSSQSKKQKLAKQQKKNMKKIKKLAESSNDECEPTPLDELFKYPFLKKQSPERLALLNLSDPDNLLGSDELMTMN